MDGSGVAGSGAEDKVPRDPRTRLPVVDVPPEHAKFFSGLKGTVMHWFGVVNKFNRMWTPDRRVAIFSDSCIYLCRLNGDITRCVQVRTVARVLIGEDSAIGFQVNAPDYDMLIQLENVQQREAVLNVVKSVYYRLEGRDLEVTNLSDEASTALQQALKLAKPPGYRQRIEPIRSMKALMKMIDDQKKKEDDDKRIVEQEFRRIKEGLRQELQQYRTDEYERMVEQLAKHAKALEEKDREIQRLKMETVSKDDPELWKQCPNCARMHERLSSNSNDDKQKILRLERELDSQRHIMEHLQAAIQFRSTNQRGQGGDADAGQLQAARQELAEANRRNKELQQLIMSSPVLTTEIKQRAARIATHRDGATSHAGYTSGDWADVVAEKEREVRHLKGLLKDATFRHVQELEAIRGQFQRYDERIVEYLEKVFAGSVQPSGRGGTVQQVARATADAARDAAGGGYGTSSTALRMAQAQAAKHERGDYGYSATDFEPAPAPSQSGYGSAGSPRGYGGAASPSGGGGGYQRFDPVGNGSPVYTASPSGARFHAGASPTQLNAVSPIQASYSGSPSYR